MTKLLMLLIILFNFNIANSAIYSSMCPDWSSDLTYNIGKCVSDEGINYYSEVNIGTYQRPLYGNQWTKCSDLIDSTICEDQFLTCVDNSSIKKDTVYLYDTLWTNISLNDTTWNTIILNDTNIININKYDTTYINVDKFDTTVIAVDKFDTIINIVIDYDTNHINVDKFDTSITIITKYDTTFKQITAYDTTIVFILDTTIINKLDTVPIYEYDSLKVQITLKDTSHLIIIDTTHIELFDEVKLWIDIPKITYINQDSLTNSPYFYGTLDSLLYNLNDSDVVSVNWSIYVYDNIGQVINHSVGLDTLFSNNAYNQIKVQLIDKNEFGNLIADNKKLISTGVYIIKGSAIVYLNNIQQYRDFYTKRIGYFK